MDPFTVGLFLTVGLFVLTRSATVDLVAAARGQTPPSHAYRMAVLEARREAAARGKDVDLSDLRGRTRVRDLAKNWWSDWLDTADNARRDRHQARPVRKMRRAARRARRKEALKRGYQLIEERGKRRFGDSKEASPTEAEDTRPADTDENQAPKTRDAQVIDLDSRRQTPKTPDSSEDASPEAPGEDRPQVPEADENGERMSDAPTLAEVTGYTGHRAALTSYVEHYQERATQLEMLADRMAANKMGASAVTPVREAMSSCLAMAAQAQAVLDHLIATHQTIYEQRSASPDAADGTYLKGN